MSRPSNTIRGSISHGTMLVDDLIPVFISVLEEVKPKKAQEFRDEYNEVHIREEDAEDHIPNWCTEADEELKDYILNDLFSALNEIAPKGCYFGAHEGDGADYGFWDAGDLS